MNESPTSSLLPPRDGSELPMHTLLDSRAQTLYQGWIFVIRVRVNQLGMRFSAKEMTVISRI
jgi:hypothetical protein